MFEILRGLLTNRVERLSVSKFGPAFAGGIFVVAYSVLMFAGILLTAYLEPWLTNKPPPNGVWTPGLYVLPIGFFGAALVRLGVRMMWGFGEAKTVFSPWKVLGVGLLFIGAAQAYLGRWFLAGAFAAGPLIISSCLSIFMHSIGSMKLFFPTTVHSFLNSAFWCFGSISLGWFFLLFWLASLFDGYLRAKSISDLGKGFIPNAKGVAIALGIAYFSYVLCVQLVLTSMVDYVPEGVEFVGRRAAHLTGRFGGTVEPDPCPRSRVGRLNRRAEEWQAIGGYGEAAELARQALSLRAESCGPQDLPPVTISSSSAVLPPLGKVVLSRDACVAPSPEQGILVASRALSDWRPENGSWNFASYSGCPIRRSRRTQPAPRSRSSTRPS